LDIITGALKPDNIPGYTQTLKDLETMTIGDICIACMETPGHTEDHVSFIVTHVTPTSTKIPFLFCADTLFIAGCGRLLGGTAEQLFFSLQKLMHLPNETLVFCAHEYTLANLQFAKYVEPNNPMIDAKIKQCEQIRAQNEFTVGSKLMEERFFNPFIRCASEDYFKELTGEPNDPVRAFAKIRKLKDNYKIGMTL
jgi:hydroxyacylglutathione hydrolase